MNSFAKNLTELMKEKNVSQVKLAKHLKVGQQTISKYMNNKIEPRLDAVIKIAAFFEVTVDYLLGAKDRYL